LYPSPSRLPSLQNSHLLSDSTTIPDLKSRSTRHRRPSLLRFYHKPRKLVALTELSKSEVAFNSSPPAKLVKAKKDGFGGDKGTTESMKVMSVKSSSNSLKVYI
ncbi:unnamed protein product, partial [Brassica rapa]